MTIPASIHHLAAGLLITLLAAPALGDDLDPALVYALGAKFDKSFNEAAHTGAERFRADTGIAYRDVETTMAVQREQTLRRLAERGHDPIVVIGFGQAAALAVVAAEFPDTRFTLVDAVVERPNVRSVVFREHEGAFVVGALAAMASRTGIIGFVGGMDIPLVRRFACGYAQGAKHIDPDIRVLQNMAGTTQAAFNDPATGKELGRSQLDRGADVIFAAAGSTSFGTHQAVVEAGELLIGVDSNQNHLHPGYFLTSLLKRVDNAVYDSFMAARAGTWEPGVQSLGIKEGGMDWALDQHNRALVTPAMEETAGRLSAGIARGELPVHDYMSDGRCPH